MKLGLCTGGGDCPGLNAAIRAVVKHAVGTYGAEVIGIDESFNGLLDRPMRVAPLHINDVTDILSRGGTILGTTNRGDPFAFPTAHDGNSGKAPSNQDLSTLLLDAWKQLGLDALIVVGGDGTQAIANRLSQIGINVIGIPKTIDNDLAETEVTIGFDTAVQIATEAVTRLQSTAESHDRIMVVEVMGRDAGYIALHSGIAGGANIILLPEIPFDFAAVIAKIDERRRLGRNFSLIVVAEGAHPAGGDAVYAQHADGSTRLGGIAAKFANELTLRTKLESRVTVLGHVQRGGAPSPFDRVLATAFGTHAVDLAAQKRYNRVVVMQNNKITDVPYAKVAGKARPIAIASDPYVKAAESIGICLGRPNAFSPDGQKRP